MTQGDKLPPINFKALNDALLAMAETLVPMWLPGGTKQPGSAEYACASLSGGKGTSCSVNLRTGAWADFATEDKGGDLVSLYAAIHGLDQGRAAVQVARDYALEDVAGVTRDAQHQRPAAPVPPPPQSKKKPATEESWRTMMPVPVEAPAATFKHQFRSLSDIEHTAAYRKDGHLLGYVVRFRTSDGGKETLPYTWCTSARDGASKWHWKQWDEPRPLYFPGGDSPSGLYEAKKPPRTVVLVEGEKKADTLQALLDAGAPGVYLVASWPGGSKAWKKALWEWLAGCAVLLWPDCDAKRVPLTKKEKEACADEAAIAAEQAKKPLLPEHKQPGMAAMLGIGALLRDTQLCKVQLLPIPKPGEVPDGWDCGDAINTDGWDFERVRGFFGRAQPLPADAGAEDAKPEAAGAGGGGGKKNDGPASADEGDAARKPMPWWLKPYWDSDKGRWMVSRKLVIAALTRDEALEGILGLNLLSNNIEARRPWPWLHAKAGPVTGAVDLQLGQYLSRQYGLPSITRQALMEGIETIAHENPFHPIREHLQGLKHDGKARLDRWLIYVIGEDPETLAPVMAEYLRLVGRYLLLGMVNRVMEPGCKFDYCPVFEGPGGLGKSTLVETLASVAYFSDTHFDVGRGKEGQEQVQGLWVYEIAELSNFGKAEISLIKAFISGKVDRYRPSYGRVVESYPRQCVMCGTTNETAYLRDRTGNRRFWPVPVRQRIKLAWLKKYRDQLLAEAYAAYLQGERFTPSPEEEARLFVPMQESRLVETAVMGELQRVLTRPPAATGIGSQINELTDFVTLAELTHALGVDAAKSTAQLEKQIREWMEHEGWERAKKQINGVRAWGWLRPSNWPAREEGNTSTQGPPPPQAGTGGQAGQSTEAGGDDEPF